ncbi:hypothetical protein [Edwardsiella ictaluri]|uniref:hypothetical protein n=1 Tax=Edwardsiella ictaluri TaxID=67780 RepID=UPI000FFC4CCB|nr:hypothetical protein [Edwardsiella ictaluri]EKS7769453.1 hypothetical protein [Edwardsiella ictaluri]EKS7772602.1 hypothetical protein [Edwardsiella ictaluri]EKS7775094.1 hypothetical protein [Edwardsiella ictaluri]EKS7785215.1 hypothetical protein [Edwardsiella ictaluri]
MWLPMRSRSPDAIGGRKEYKAATGRLQAGYQTPTEATVLMVLDAFAELWDEKYLQISTSWRIDREDLNALFSYL